jgi:hypothetical protein
MISMKNSKMEDEKMKKLCLLLILSTMLVFFTTGVQAGGLHLFFNAGVVTDDSLSFDPFLWSLGANLDYHLGEFLMISPEANVVSYQFKFDTFLFQPAVLLNLKFRSFFVGGGIQKYILITGDSYTAAKWGLKLNAGFVSKNFRLRCYMDMEFDNLFKNMLVGFQIGIGF